jgi:hypothetical protein
MRRNSSKIREILPKNGIPVVLQGPDPCSALLRTSRYFLQRYISARPGLYSKFWVRLVDKESASALCEGCGICPPLIRKKIFDARSRL